jgi:hypothetical protein
MQYSSQAKKISLKSALTWFVLPVLSSLLIACGSGEDGLNALISTTNITAGAECPAGGVRIQAGKDSNGNGVLEANEVLSTAVVCNGSTGASGATGPAGPAGPQGPMGPIGPSGISFD